MKKKKGGCSLIRACSLIRSNTVIKMQIQDDQMQKWRDLQLAMDLPEFEEVDASWDKFYD